MIFLPDDTEEQLIEKIIQFSKAEFALVRITKTMFVKSIIDANKKIREILKEGNIVDFDIIIKNQKEYKTTTIIAKSIKNARTSFYRPNTKEGDPRLWIYGLRKDFSVGDLLYISTFKNEFVVIRLKENENFDKNLIDFFGIDSEKLLIKELTQKIRIISSKGWIESVSPNKKWPKDVGATLEAALGIPMNSLKVPDYREKIEIKCKRKNAGSNDSLFSKAPNWGISRIKSSAEMILTYGYLSQVHQGFHDLYVTVSNTPNSQGLFNHANDNTFLLNQLFKGQGKSIDVCSWTYDELKRTIESKHLRTVWLIAEERIIEGKIHFYYNSLVLTEKPIFSQFISLINQGIIKYDWRGKVRPNRTGYRDHGHGFRINPANRGKLFGKTKEIKISSKKLFNIL